MTGPHVTTDLPAMIDLRVMIGPHEMIVGGGRSETNGDTNGTGARETSMTAAARARHAAVAALR